MSPVFKTLASIVVWILFVVGCVGLIHFFVTVGRGEPIVACEVISVACLILSVCAMKLRQMLE